MARSPTENATERLVRALAARDAGFVDDREGATLEGVFRPRGGPLPLERLRTVLRSWELFDRAYEPLPDEEAEELVAARLSGIELGDAETGLLSEGILVFGDGVVVALEAETFRRWLSPPPRA